MALLFSSSDAWAQTNPAPPSGNPWPVSTAAARFTIEPDAASQKTVISTVTLGLPNPAWANAPIRVFTDAGVAVGSDLLWSAPGEPTTLVFDSSSGAKQYQVYAGSNWPALAIPDAKAGVWLESRAGDGKTIDHLPDMQLAWNASTTVNGRAILSGLFEGGHRFGPQGNLLEHYQGWFELDKPAHLQLAAISTDASFILVDGKDVVEWPGRHDFHPGLGGQFQGAVDLEAGVHQLEYFNAYVSSNEGRPMLCCVAAKGGPLDNWTMLSADKNFFRPVGHVHVVNYEPTPAGGVPAFAIDWSVRGQSMIAADVTDVGFVDLHLVCHPAIGTATWTFDDGSTVQGADVTHLLLRPGSRTVQLTVKDGDKILGTLSQTINVHPEWTLFTTYPPQLAPEHRDDLMHRDPGQLSASDLASCVAVLGTFRNAEGLLKFQPAVGAKIKEIADADLPRVKDAAVWLSRFDLPHFAEAGQLLQAVVERCPTDQAASPLTAVGSQARLALAQLTLKTSDRTDDVRALLNAIKPETLSDEERHSFQLLQGDLALATGDVAGAKKQYEAITGDASGPDARSSIRRTAKIGQARAFMDKKEYEAAERALNEVARQAAVEKLSPDWALTRLRLYQEQNLPLIAYLWAKRLQPVITGNSRSELLFRLTDLAFAQNDADLAKKSFEELLKKHPYSEEAAAAKAKWPNL